MHSSYLASDIENIRKPYPIRISIGQYENCLTTPIISRNNTNDSTLINKDSVLSSKERYIIKYSPHSHYKGSKLGTSVGTTTTANTQQDHINKPKDLSSNKFSRLMSTLEHKPPSNRNTFMKQSQKIDNSHRCRSVSRGGWITNLSNSIIVPQDNTTTTTTTTTITANTAMNTATATTTTTTTTNLANKRLNESNRAESMSTKCYTGLNFLTCTNENDDLDEDNHPLQHHHHDARDKQDNRNQMNGFSTMEQLITEANNSNNVQICQTNEEKDEKGFIERQRISLRDRLLKTNDKENHNIPRLTSYMNIEFDYDSVTNRKSFCSNPTHGKLRLNNSRASKHILKTSALKNKMNGNFPSISSTKIELIGNDIMNQQQQQQQLQQPQQQQQQQHTLLLCESKISNTIQATLTPQISCDFDLSENCNNENDEINFITSSVLRIRDDNISQDGNTIPHHHQQQQQFQQATEVKLNRKVDEKKPCGSMALLRRSRIGIGIAPQQQQQQQFQQQYQQYYQHQLQLQQQQQRRSHHHTDLKIKGRSMDIRDSLSLRTLRKKGGDENQEPSNTITRMKTSISAVETTEIAPDVMKQVLAKTFAKMNKVVMKSASPIRSMANKLSEFSRYNRLELLDIQRELGDSISNKSDDSTLREYIGNNTKSTKAKLYE